MAPAKISEAEAEARLISTASGPCHCTDSSRSLRTLMHSQAVPLVATHDPRLVAITEELIRRSGRRPGSYEFQMMYGIRPLEQRRLVDIGHPTRVYVPFGPGWYDYYVRRLAERPALAALFARSLVGKR